MSYGTENNPYDSPRNTGFGGAGGSDPQIQGKVKGPAIALIVTGVLGILLCIYALAMNLTGATAAQQQQQMNQINKDLNQQQQELIKTIFAAQGALGLVQGVIGLIVSAVIIWGSLKMMKLESYGLAMTASILAMIPCVSPCCILGLPFGIWSLVVLMNAEVKSAFH